MVRRIYVLHVDMDGVAPGLDGRPCRAAKLHNQHNIVVVFHIYCFYLFFHCFFVELEFGLGVGLVVGLP